MQLIDVPISCGQCESCENTGKYYNKPYCRLAAFDTKNSFSDISTIQVNPNSASKPTWCPIIKMNNDFIRLSKEKQEILLKLKRGITMKWDDFVNNIISDEYNNKEITDIECPYCQKRKIYYCRDTVYTSMPPKYRYECECGWSGFGPAYRR